MSTNHFSEGGSVGRDFFFFLLSNVECWSFVAFEPTQVKFNIPPPPTWLFCHLDTLYFPPRTCYVESRKYVHYQVWGRRVFGPSVTSTANLNSLGDAIAFSVKQWQTAYRLCFFSYKILMKKISQNHKINCFSLIFKSKWHQQLYFVNIVCLQRFYFFDISFYIFILLCYLYDFFASNQRLYRDVENNTHTQCIAHAAVLNDVCTCVQYVGHALD